MVRTFQRRIKGGYKHSRSTLVGIFPNTARFGHSLIPDIVQTPAQPSPDCYRALSIVHAR
jgi:hypothetical protein